MHPTSAWQPPVKYRQPPDIHPTCTLHTPCLPSRCPKASSRTPAPSPPTLLPRPFQPPGSEEPSTPTPHKQTCRPPEIHLPPALLTAVILPLCVWLCPNSTPTPHPPWLEPFSHKASSQAPRLLHSQLLRLRYGCTSPGMFLTYSLHLPCIYLAPEPYQGRNSRKVKYLLNCKYLLLSMEGCGSIISEESK